MKKIIVLVLLMVFGIASVGYCATNWSKFENKGNNLRVEGYQGQPGYIRFDDGNGNTSGYLWMNKTTNKPVWCSPDAIDLTTTQLTDAIGVPIDAED